MKVLRCLAPLALIPAIIFSCAGKEEPDTSTSGGGHAYKSVFKWEKPVDVFGFQPQNRYAYCPSVVELEDGTCHMFFCGNPTAGEMVDNIYHIKIGPDGSQTAPESVLQPTPGSWDSFHCCDPSVIAGEFKMDGVEYRYAMFYLGIDKGDCKGNEIGVAFSNSLDASSWVKYPKQLIAFPENRDKAWGVGQPSAFSLDKKGSILLTYTKGDITGTGVMLCRVDMADVSELQIADIKPITTLGFNHVLHNCDFAVDVENQKVVGVFSGTWPDVYPTFIESYNAVAYVGYDDFIKSRGTWTRLSDIDYSVSGYYRNHNACVLRDAYGYMKNYKTPTVFFTISETASVAEWSYRIWRVDSRIEKVEI